MGGGGGARNFEIYVAKGGHLLYDLFLQGQLEFATGFVCIQWRIQDFPQDGAPIPKIAIIFQFFAENCMKMKEFGPQGEGDASLAPPWIRQWYYVKFFLIIKQRLNLTI